jgi:hypothetical protein
MSKSTKDDGWKPGLVSHEEWTRESRRRAELVEQATVGIDVIRRAHTSCAEWTNSTHDIQEERWAALADTLEALVGLLAPRAGETPGTKDGGA